MIAVRTFTLHGRKDTKKNQYRGFLPVLNKIKKKIFASKLHLHKNANRFQLSKLLVDFATCN